MERDLADDLDALICASKNAIYDEDYGAMANLAMAIFAIWIGVAAVVYLLASYLVQSSAKDTAVTPKEEPPKIEPIIEVEAVKSEEVKVEEVVKVNYEPKWDVPLSIGSDSEAVTWVNACMTQIFTSPTLTATLTQLWMDAMSAYIDSIGENVSVQLEGILDYVECPKFTNLVTQSHPNDNMTITLDIEARDLSMKGHVCKSGGEKIPAKMILKRLRGRAAIAVLSRERVVNAKLEGWPEIVYSIDSLSRLKLDEDLAEIVKELATSALRGAQININLEDFGGSVVSPFPVFRRKVNLLNEKDQDATPKSEAKVVSDEKVPFPTLRKKAKRFLHTCVAKAVNLPNDAISPFVIMELDEPSQRFKTDTAQFPMSTEEAVWNQTFTFELKNTSKELLFEVWNNNKTETFLGLGIVAISELQLSQQQRLVIPLQGNPGAAISSDAFSGLLTVQFLVTQDDIKAKESFKSTLNAEMEAISVLEDHEQNNHHQADENGHKEDEPDSPFIGSRSRVRNKRDHLVSRFKKRMSASASLGRSTTSIAPSVITNDQMTPGTKRKSTMEKINDQFNSIITGIRAMSADRIRSASQNRGMSSNDGTLQRENGSQSDLSGISSASAKTYITEESSLVLESRDKNGTLQHFLIPYHEAKAKRGRIGRKGTKLHIYMDHVFVAQRIKGGTLCTVCQMNIPLRLGKQGYVCRDCSLTCHKPCHVKVQEHCLDTSLPHMELLFLDGK